VRLVLEAGYLVRRHAAQDRLGAFRHGLDDDEVAEALQEILDEAAGIVAGLDDAVHGAEDGSGVGSGHGVHDVVQQGRVGVAQECHGKFVVQPAGAGTRHQLVQDGERIAD
jgi:hypothetical protein